MRLVRWFGSVRALPYTGWLILIFTFVFAALRPAAAAAQQANEGKVTFDKMCAACHGKTGDGKGPAAAGLKPKPASFTDPAFQAQRTDDSLRAFIIKGKPPMPGFGKQLNPAQVTSLVAHIRTFGATTKKP